MTNPQEVSEEDIEQLKHDLDTGSICNHKVVAKLFGYYNRTRDMQWVSVKDRLPEEGHWYLATIKGDKFSRILFYDGKNEHGIHWLKDGDFLGCVTHWMTLPTEPKQREGL